jgi:hypothetical protein
MSDFKNYVLKIVSKSPSQHLVRIEGKLKLTEKENNLYVLFTLFNIPMY